jgi:hypothetical protein
MKFTKFWFILLIIFCSSVLVSCASSWQPPVTLDEKYVNQQILLRTSKHNTFTTNDSILLEMKYNSTNEIVFPRDYNLRLFENTKDGWVEIYEKPVTRNPPDDIVLSPNKYISFIQAIFVFPDLPNYDRKYKLRIYVFGEMKEEGEIVEVAAYTDVVLHP